MRHLGYLKGVGAYPAASSHITPVTTEEVTMWWYFLGLPKGLSATAESSQYQLLSTNWKMNKVLLPDPFLIPCILVSAFLSLFSFPILM